MLGTLIRSLQGNGQPSIRKQSATRFGRWPLYEIAFGPRWSHGEQHGHAKAVFAIGDQATGVVAVGGLAQGIVALGGVAVGGLALGGVAIGVVTRGGVSIGLSASGKTAVSPDR